jgi:phospholipid transport system substrate-binding protein
MFQSRQVDNALMYEIAGKQQTRTFKTAAFLLPCLLAVLLLLPLPAKATIDGGAPSAFISELGTAAIAMLSNKDLDQKSKIDQFRELLQNGFALKAISRFVLGPYWKKTSPEQRERYTALFEEYVISSYANRLRDYGGETFKVTGEKLYDEKSAAVSTLILRPNGEPVVVDWRIRRRNGELKIVDVVIEGISMGQTQRSDFGSAIRGKGGDIDAFLDVLERKVRRK